MYIMDMETDEIKHSHGNKHRGEAIEELGDENACKLEIHQLCMKGRFSHMYIAQDMAMVFPLKRFLKRNLAHVGMVQCMNALADKVHKQEVPCTQ